jgi:hypothetical protein
LFNIKIPAPDGKIGRDGVFVQSLVQIFRERRKDEIASEPCISVFCQCL